jgi:histidyl-tRNA synthetase
VSTKYQAVKGMRDLLSPEIDTWHFIERTAAELLGNYGYSELRTPIVEDTELFKRSVGEGTDIVGKEMYDFLDKGGRSIAMRPEGTAPAARAYLEHSMQQKGGVTRWYYLGPMFRYERMKKGRYRSFWQLGVEAYGAAGPAQDVEVMELAAHFLERLGLKDVSLQINSLGDEKTRPAYVEKVRAHFAGHAGQMSEDAKQTLALNPIRLLDSKEEALAPLIASAPVMLDALDDESRVHFAEVQRLLTLVGVKFEINPRLVRGLDYYTRTAFELVAKQAGDELGTANVVGGGGRYDRLIEQLGGQKAPAVGWAFGIDRLAMLLGDKGHAVPAALFVVAVDPAAKDEALRLITALRHQGFKVDFDPRAGSRQSQLTRAEKTAATRILEISGAEVASRRAQLRHVPTKATREVSLDALAAELN